MRKNRVVRRGGMSESGVSGHYRWGEERKLALLAWEAAQRDVADA